VTQRRAQAAKAVEAKAVANDALHQMITLLIRAPLSRVPPTPFRLVQPVPHPSLLLLATAPLQELD